MFPPPADGRIGRVSRTSSHPSRAPRRHNEAPQRESRSKRRRPRRRERAKRRPQVSRRERERSGLHPAKAASFRKAKARAAGAPSAPRLDSRRERSAAVSIPPRRPAFAKRKRVAARTRAQRSPSRQGGQLSQSESASRGGPSAPRWGRGASAASAGVVGRGAPLALCPMGGGPAFRPSKKKGRPARGESGWGRTTRELATACLGPARPAGKPDPRPDEPSHRGLGLVFARRLGVPPDHGE